MEEGSAVASVGLCAACRHVRVIRSDRGLVFIFVGVEMGEAGKERPDIAWEFAGPGGAYTGRMLIDGEFYTPSEATKKFLQAALKAAPKKR